MQKKFTLFKIVLPAVSMGLLLLGFTSRHTHSVNTRKTADTASLFTDLGDNVMLNNGLVTAIISKKGAHITSYRYQGHEVMRDGYYSMDGGKGYSQPNECVFSVKQQNANMADLCFKSTWRPGLRQQAFDIEVHYVIKKGVSGVYGYAILNHPASYPATGVGEWRFVWKLPADVFDHIVVDTLRNMDMPSAADYAHGEHTSIPEATKILTGVKAGQYECKYNYSVEYYKLGTYGHTSNTNKFSAWMVLGGYDYFNDGPTAADLNAAAGIIHLHFGRDHYAGSGTHVEAGEQWSKIFGPYLLYLNSSNLGTKALWADAQRRVATEKAQWPYAWLTNTPEYPAADQRGTVSGNFTIADPYKPQLTGAHAWVGLTVPGTDWERDSKNYQYWIKADAQGHFTIPAIRPGNYTLHAFVDGAVGEYTTDNITIKAGQKLNIGTQKWVIPRNKGQLIWEIGIPNRSAIEFKFGKQAWQPFMWETYSPALPNPLVYTVGQSDWHNDWNYVHSGYFDPATRKFSAWPWKINFTLNKLAPTGVATLTIAFASTDRGVLQTFINDDTKPLDTFTPSHNTGGNALVRQGIHAKYSTYILNIPVSKLHTGQNTITLLQSRNYDRTQHLMYDYLSLEVPQ